MIIEILLKIKLKKLYNKYLDEKDTTYLELKNSFEKNYNQRRIEKFYKI